MYDFNDYCGIFRDVTNLLKSTDQMKKIIIIILSDHLVRVKWNQFDPKVRWFGKGWHLN